VDPLLETIDLDIEEANELLFKVKVEGVAPSPAKVRLVCEIGEIGYVFQGHATQEEGIVQFLLPVLKGKLQEGLYQSRVEVLIENRYFAPVQFNVNFKQTMKVVAEAVRAPVRQAPSKLTVTASPVVVQKPTVAPPAPPKTELRPAIIESPQPKPVVPETKAPVKPVTRKAAPAPAKFNASMTLKERYNTRLDEREELVEELDEGAAEDLIRELAQQFVKTNRKSKK
jgi:hypothetical protein